MGKQLNKTIKRSRRTAYNKRQKALIKTRKKSAA